ncbi:MAG: zinc-binding dehydrogenase, partial [bacterium]
LRNLVEASGATVIERNDLRPGDYPSLVEELTGGRGFDDIIVLDPRRAEHIGAIARHIARRGTLNLVGQSPLDGLVDTDVGRLHYDYIALLGNRGPDIARSYGEARNRCELRAGGLTVVIGAGGPMGQMHVQRAIELPDGPRAVVATEISDERLETLRQGFAPLAEQHEVALHALNPTTPGNSLHDLVMSLTGGEGADDVVVCVPNASLMAEAAAMMHPDGMLVLFAGVPNGTLAPLNLSHVYLHNAQYTGTSGLTLEDQRQVMERAKAGSLSPERVVAAIGGMNAALDGLQALIDGRYPGKIVIFPQIPDLPLTGLDELAQTMPEVARELGPGNTWTREAEAALFERMWSDNGEGTDAQ